jgi:hypothetical protein
MSALTQERVKGLFDYRDGQLFWKERPRSDFKTDLAYLQWNPKHAGKQAGCYSGQRHGTVAIDKRHYNLHRIIFLWHHGYEPEIVDHADCNPQNNLIENLRAANKAENQRNSGMFSHNTSGYKGVVWSKVCQKWIARVKVHGKTKHLGVFEDIEFADLVAQEARNKFHGAFARHN